MSRFAKSGDDLMPTWSSVITLPEIVIITFTSTGNKGIKNHQTPIQDMHGDGSKSEEIERAILENMKYRADRLSHLISFRLEEL